MRKPDPFRGVGPALDRLYAAAADTPGQRYDIQDPNSRMIILSDLHRGARNRADDFRHSERAFNAALGYYYELGYTLVILGDAEELWQERPADILQAYRHSLDLEAEFHRQGRYLRFWGNHDDEWRSRSKVRRYLSRVFGPDLRVHEGLQLHITEGEQELGRLFLVHGHQGSLEGDRWGGLSRFLVRTLYRPFQRLTGFSHSTPATSWELREGHNRALHDWTTRHPEVLLIAGHTHRPVYASQTHPDQLLEDMQQLRDLAAHPDTPTADRPGIRASLAERAAELEWARAQQASQSGDEGTAAAPRQPRYFNTGCCCYTDGQITGIELCGNEIRLVRWPDKQGRPRPEILAPVSPDGKPGIRELLRQ
ncbi:metallophosphoesterase [Spirochaeta africana]|nr:metallophosphoesterase [Spirochaeta africana]